MLHLTSKITSKAASLRNSFRFSSTHASDVNAWSSSLSFTSPESDFTGGESRHVELSDISQDRTNVWSSSLSFASPESDFTAGVLRNKILDHVEQNENDRSRLVYSLSFAQAESDYTSLPLTDDMEEQLSNVKSFNPRVKVLDQMEQNENDRSRLVYSLSFAQAESDYTSLLLTDDMKEQLSNVKPLNMINNQAHEAPLPTTLEEALQHSDEAQVITELAPPFRILKVNKAWEELCGFRRDECFGKSMRMIQGPETDIGAVEATIDQVMTGEPASVVLTNYKKGGKKFRNRLRVGPLFGENGDQITHLVGVLQEIQGLNANRSIQNVM